MSYPNVPYLPPGVTRGLTAGRIQAAVPVRFEHDSGPEFSLTAAARDYAVIEDPQEGTAVIDEPDDLSDAPDRPTDTPERDPMDPGDETRDSQGRRVPAGVPVKRT